MMIEWERTSTKVSNLIWEGVRKICMTFTSINSKWLKSAQLWKNKSAAAPRVDLLKIFNPSIEISIMCCSMNTPSLNASISRFRKLSIHHKIRGVSCSLTTLMNNSEAICCIAIHFCAGTSNGDWRFTPEAFKANQVKMSHSLQFSLSRAKGLQITQTCTPSP